MRLVSRILIALAALGMVSFQAGSVAAQNGGGGTPGDDPPYVVGSGYVFFNNSCCGSPNVEGPWTFTAISNVVLRVQDFLCAGDRYQVFDFGSSIGFTSVPGASTCSVFSGTPQAAEGNSNFSFGLFNLGAGLHAITFVLLQTCPECGGAATSAFRVDPGGETPELDSMILFAVGGFAVAGYMYRQRRKQLAA